MSVFVRATGIQTVIQMNSFEAFKPDNPVKFIQHAIQVVDNIITAIPDVAGIQANTQFVLQFYPVNDGPQFLERTANFGAFSGHGFQEHCGGLGRREDTVEFCGNALPSAF